MSKPTEENEEGFLDEAVDFVIDGIRVHDQPCCFDLMIEGKVLKLTAVQLASPRRFRRHFFEVLHRIPKVPRREEDWAALVNGWLAMAPEVPEAPLPPAPGLPCP